MGNDRNYSAGKPWKLAKQQHILETAFRLFTEKGIELVSIPEIAKASGVGRATVFRYFPTKLELVLAVGTQKWEEYISLYDTFLPREKMAQMTGAEYLRFYLDAFLDLYRNHGDILRFNYNFNNYLWFETGTPEQRESYLRMTDRLGRIFHELYERGQRDGTLNTEIPEPMMFSATFHIMLAAVTRYAVGLAVVYENGGDPENELIMLKDMLFSRFTKKNVPAFPLSDQLT